MIIGNLVTRWRPGGKVPVWILTALSILVVSLVVLVVSVVVKAKNAVADSDKTQMLMLQRDRERALNALMGTPQYAAFQIADAKVEQFYQELNKKYGCKIDGQTVECAVTK
jgi:hypothetical protein